MERGEAIAAMIFGPILAAAGYLAAHYVEIGGVTYGGFYYGIILGAGLFIIGLVGLVRGPKRPSETSRPPQR